MERLQVGKVYHVRINVPDNVLLGFVSEVVQVDYPWDDEHIGRVTFKNGVLMERPDCVTFTEFIPGKPVQLL